ncbi:MAG: hypothetical protein JJ956_09390 [Pseudomonadales bacterium]|nr:hypothetical protein [Pseudomonadales bacterium]
MSFTIVSLVSTLLLQGFGFALSLYERLQSRSVQYSEELMVSSWFRQTVHSMVASKMRGESLKGSTIEFSGVTVAPLIGTRGIPTEFSWIIDNGKLYYREFDQTIVIREIEINSTFSFRSEAGIWFDSWPQDLQSFDLPAAVRFDDGSGGIVTSGIRMRLKPDLLLEESRLER